VESLNYYKKVYPTPLKNQGKETSLRFKKSARKIALGINLGSKTYAPVSGIENDIENEDFVKVILISFFDIIPYKLRCA